MRDIKILFAKTEYYACARLLQYAGYKGFYLFAQVTMRVIMILFVTMKYSSNNSPLNQ